MGWFSNPDAQRLDIYEVESGEWTSMADAKSEWFLTSDDLKMQLAVGSFGGGVGAGRAKTYYLTCNIMKAAMRKFGDDGLRKKQEVCDAFSRPLCVLTTHRSAGLVRSCTHIFFRSFRRARPHSHSQRLLLVVTHGTGLVCCRPRRCLCSQQTPSARSSFVHAHIFFRSSWGLFRLVLVLVSSSAL